MTDETHGSDLFEIIRTTRSMRRLKPDPVPNELIRKILEAGTCAPSGGNMQRWVQFEKEAEAALGFARHPFLMPCCRLATRWDGSGQSACRALRCRL